MASIENLISSSKVRKLLELSRSGERHMRARGGLPDPIKIGKRNFYVRAELEIALGLRVDDLSGVVRK